MTCESPSLHKCSTPQLQPQAQGPLLRCIHPAPLPPASTGTASQWTLFIHSPLTTPTPPDPRCCNAPGYDRPATHLGPLYLKTLTGRTLTLEQCHSIDTGYDLRLRVALAEAMPVEDQRLIFAGEGGWGWGGGCWGCCVMHMLLGLLLGGGELLLGLLGLLLGLLCDGSCRCPPTCWGPACRPLSRVMPAPE
jgi:hypothetical protein